MPRFIFIMLIFNKRIETLLNVIIRFKQDKNTLLLLLLMHLFFLSLYNSFE